MGKRSRGATTTTTAAANARQPATTANPSEDFFGSPHSPPFKKRAVSGCGSNDTDTHAVPTLLEKDEAAEPLSSPSLPGSYSSTGSSESLENPRQGREGVAHAGVKRSRTDDDDSVKKEAFVGLRRSARRRGEDDGAVLRVDASSSSSSSSSSRLLASSSTVSNTNRTLVYDAAGAPTRVSHGANSATSEASAATLSGSPLASSPPRRNVVLLTSTPAFIRHGGQRGTHDGDGADPAAREDYSPPPATASVSVTPLRLMQAARGLLSPARSTLLRGFSHLRQSVTGTGTRRPAPSTPPSPSPLGRLSSIKPAGDNLPSFSTETGSVSNPRRGDAPRHAAATAPTLLSLGVSSIPGSGRSSVSASEAWGNSMLGGEGKDGGGRRPTIHRDSDDALESSASVRTASLSSSRVSSPTVRGVEEADVASHTRRYRDSRYGHRYPRPPGVALDDRPDSGATAALTGPCDARYASVSSLSESLVNVVSSSRSTAQSSLTSASAAGGSVGQSDGVVSAARDASGAAAVMLPRRSATAMAPNLSSILPDEEEQAIRRRLQRYNNLHRGQPPPEAAGTAQKSSFLQHSSRRRARPSSANVLELRPVGPPVSRSDTADLSAGPHRRHNDGGGGGGSRDAATATSTDQQRREPRVFHTTTASTPLHHLAARTSRTAVGFCVLAALLWCVATTAWPLLALQTPYTVCEGRRLATDTSSLPAYAASEEAFLSRLVNPMSDLQALYHIDPHSLDVEGVAWLQRRTLSEAVERLERATQHLAPTDDTPPPHRLFYLRAMIHAYLVVHRNSELYARSRDTSAWRRLVRYPLADVLRYGFYRFDSLVRDVSLTHSFVRDWQDRLSASVACSAQSEFVRCPSLLYVEEAMARAAAPFVYTDTNEALESPQRRRRLRDWRACLHRDWASEVYLETLLGYLRNSVQKMVRDYRN